MNNPNNKIFVILFIFFLIFTKSKCIIQLLLIKYGDNMEQKSKNVDWGKLFWESYNRQQSNQTKVKSPTIPPLNKQTVTPTQTVAPTKKQTPVQNNQNITFVKPSEKKSTQQSNQAANLLFKPIIQQSNQFGTTTKKPIVQKIQQNESIINTNVEKQPIPPSGQQTTVNPRKNTSTRIIDESLDNKIINTNTNINTKNISNQSSISNSRVNESTMTDESRDTSKDDFINECINEIDNAFDELVDILNGTNFKEAFPDTQIPENLLKKSTDLSDSEDDMDTQLLNKDVQQTVEQPQ